MTAITIFDNIKSVAVSQSISIKGTPYTFQGIVSGIGSVSASLTIEVSNDLVNWMTLGYPTILLSGNNYSVDGFASNAAWLYCRAFLNEISGEEAKVSLILGVVS